MADNEEEETLAAYEMNGAVNFNRLLMGLTDGEDVCRVDSH